MKIIIDHENYGVRSEFNSLVEAEAGMRACGFEGAKFEVRADGRVLDEAGQVVGEEVVGRKFIARGYGCSQTERDSAMVEHRPVVMIPMPDQVLEVVQSTATHVTLQDADGGRQRVARSTLRRGNYQGRTVAHTTWLYGPYEEVDEMTPSRTARWQAAKGTDAEMAALRFDLARGAR